MGGIVSAALPIVGSIAGSLFGGSSAPSAPSTNVYQPTGTGSQDTNLQSLLNSNTNLVGANNPYNTLSPQILQAFQSLFSSPGAPGYNAAAGQAGQAYGQVGQQGVGAGGQVSNAALGLLPGAQSVMNMGLDPQSALYNQMLQQTTDRANVNNAAYGLTGQQAAANTNQADTNFNIDWQNQQLQRAIAGLGAGGQAVDRSGTGITAGQNVGAAGAGSILAGGATPYTTQQQIGGGQETALTQYLAQLLGPATSSQQTIGDLGSYLGQGINASTAGADQSLRDYYAQLQGAGAGAAGGYALGNGFGSLFSTMAAPSVAPAGAGGIADIASAFF